ncbi:MAG: hypothetical protein WD231_05950 [Candidatus Woykebacteria bacterium]
MVGFIAENLGIIVPLAIVLSSATVGPYFFGDGHSTYDKWAYWVMKLVGFVSTLVVIPVAPYIMYKGVAEWNSDANESGIFVWLLVLTIMAAAAAIVHITRFLPATYQVFRSASR